MAGGWKREAPELNVRGHLAAEGSSGPGTGHSMWEVLAGEGTCGKRGYGR